VWVDECGTHTSMTRTRARAPKGERAYGKVPRNRGKNTTLIASMTLSGMGASMVFEGATDAPAFEIYVEHFLAPTLKEGQIVVMDQLGAHRVKRVREARADRGERSVLVVVAFLLAGPQSHRGSLLQSEGVPKKGSGAHERGALGGDN
jgi:hypothetical protein